jgi:hypothetical protein
LLAAEGVVAFGVEFGIGRHAADGAVLMGPPLLERAAVAQSFQEACRALCAGMIWRSTSTTVVHVSPCFQMRCLSPKCSTRRMKYLLTAACSNPVASTATVTGLRYLPGMRPTIRRKPRATSSSDKRVGKR